MSVHQPSVIIIGSGFGGIGAAIELTRHGFRDVTILEKGDGIGGVWRENTYPGAACDVPSPLYSYSFEPNPTWSKRYSPQAEILAYMQRTAAKYGVDRLVRLHTEVTSAAFDETTATWRVTTRTGETLEADVLVSAIGQLSRPAWPDIPGQDSFAGDSFHSAQWDHHVDLRGRRVAVIGTGASAAQFVPAIQPEARQLTLFQRSAPWIAPQPQKEYSNAHHRLFSRVPATQRLERQSIWLLLESLQRAMTAGSRVLTPGLEAVCRMRLRQKVKDPALRRKLTPDYPAGCKRVLFSNTYIDALVQPNVEVVTDRIMEVTPAGLRTVDGVEHEADVLIYGTGFAATDFLTPMQVTGLGGRELKEVWTEGARAYYGMAVPSFPNMFVMYGPNTNLGSGSIITMLEPQARYIRQAVQRLADVGPATLDLRQQVEEEFDLETQSRIKGTVWMHCNSWYRMDNGRIPTNWPGTVREYTDRIATLNPDDYELVPSTR